MTIQALLFDHDGTLVDSESVHYQLWCKVMNQYHVNFLLDDYQRYHVGIPCEDNAAVLIEQHQLEVSIDSLVVQKHRAVKEFQAQSAFPLLANVAETIDALSHHFRLAVVSGSDEYAVESSLAAHGLRDYFEVVATGDQVPNNKPAPDVYQLAMKRLNVSPSQCLAIEDTYNGLSAAVAAGVRCLAVPNEYSASHDFSAASAILTDISQCRAWCLSQ